MAGIISLFHLVGDQLFVIRSIPFSPCIFCVCDGTHVILHSFRIISSFFTENYKLPVFKNWHLDGSACKDQPMKRDFNVASA